MPKKWQIWGPDLKTSYQLSNHPGPEATSAWLSQHKSHTWQELCKPHIVWGKEWAVPLFLLNSRWKWHVTIEQCFLWCVWVRSIGPASCHGHAPPLYLLLFRWILVIWIVVHAYYWLFIIYVIHWMCLCNSVLLPAVHMPSIASVHPGEGSSSDLMWGQRSAISYVYRL